MASPLPLGKGFVTCRHGKLPVPAPATLGILKNVPVYGTTVACELVTPTGAAVASTATLMASVWPELEPEPAVQPDPDPAPQEPADQPAPKRKRRKTLDV